MNYYLKYPINLEIDALIKSNINMLPKNKVSHKEKALLILHILICFMENAKQESRYIKTNKYCNLSSSLLKLAMYNYSHYLNLLIVAGVLETDNAYKVGVKCKGYCFADAYNVFDYKTHTVNQDALKKGITRLHKKLNSEYLKNIIN